MSGYGYFGKVISAFSSALEFNTATLSGAIDIIVIEDDQGRRQCSPFHVRFGKLQLLKSRGIPVDIELNGQRTNLRMFLGAAGEAYFYNPLHQTPHEGTDVSVPEVSPHMSLGSQFESAVEEARIPERTNSVPIFHPEISVLGKTKDEAVMSRADPEHVKENDPSTLYQASHADKIRSTMQPHISNDEFDVYNFGRRRIKQTTDTDYPFGYISDSEVELTRNERAGNTEAVDEPRSPPLFSSQRKWSLTISQSSPVVHGADRKDYTALEAGEQNYNLLSGQSDGSAEEPGSLEHRSSSSPNSESMEEQTREIFTGDKQSASVAEIHESAGSNEGSERIEGDESVVRRLKEFDGSVMVSDTLSDIVGEEEGKLDCRSVDGYDADEDNVEDLQERVAYVLSKSQDIGLETGHNEGPTSYRDRRYVRFGNNMVEHKDYKEDGMESEGALDMSLCGNLIKTDMSEPEIAELFDRHRVTFEEFSSNPKLLYDATLRIRIDNRLVELGVAVPFIFAALAFNERMDVDALAKMAACEEKREEPKSPPTPSRRFRWFGWGSPAVMGEPLLDEDDLNRLEMKVDEEKKEEEKETDEKTSEEKTSEEKTSEEKTSEEKKLEENEKADEQAVEAEKKEEDGEMGREESRGLTVEKQAAVAEVMEEVGAEMGVQRPAISFSEVDVDALSLRPTTEDLNSLNLLPGANTIRFFVESSSVELHCRIFLWNSHTKIVISDVDGTITRSDVLGHLLPAVGRDWSQVGVAGLYTQIEKNGYKIVYLTARPIGQASQTREFLRSVTQGSAKLPNGPVLMSPNRLVESFTREVIRRKPQEFKIGALREVRSLFSPDYNPFHAGFGNRDTDVISYRSVGLIPQRIFVVNPKGELVVTKAKYESTASYSTLQDLVESVFPDISRQSGGGLDSCMYNDWNYWRGALPHVDIEDLL